MRRRRFSHQGAALLEVLVSLGLFAVLGFVVTSVSFDALVANRVGGERTDALAYAQEGLEASRQIRDRSWGLLATGSYGVAVETVGAETRYAFSGTSDAREVYTRVVTVEDVQRDASSNIVSSGGTVDPDTRRVVSKVTWGSAGPLREVLLTTYLTNSKGISWTETREAEFEQGVLTNTEAVPAPAPPTGNGTVQLLGAGSGPGVAVQGVVNVNLSGPTDGHDVAVAGSTVYFVTGSNAGGASFYIVDVSNPGSPTVCPTCKTDPGGRLLAVAVSGRHAYVATDRNNAELQVIDVANAASPVVGAVRDTDSSSDALSIAVDGPRLYLGTAGNVSPAPAPEFYVFSLADPANPAQTAGVELPGSPDVNGIAAAGNRVYLATSSDAAEVMVVDVSSTPAVVGTEDLPGTSDATSIVVTSNRAYVAQKNGQLSILGLSNPTDPAPLGSVSLGGIANDVAVEGAYAYVATENSAAEFQRVNIANPALPVVEGTTDLDGAARGIAVAGNYSYVATNGNDQEMAIIASAGGGTDLTIHGFLNVPGNGIGQSIALTGTTVLLGNDGQNRLDAIDVQDPAVPVLLSSVVVDGDVQDIAVSGSTAYLAVAYSSVDAELYVVDISNPSSLNILARYNVPGDKGGFSVAVSGKWLYLGLGKASGDAECVGDFLVIDVSSPTAAVLVGQAFMNHGVMDIAVDPNNQNIVYAALTRQKTSGATGCDQSDSLIQQSPPPPGASPSPTPFTMPSPTPGPTPMPSPTPGASAPRSSVLARGARRLERIFRAVAPAADAQAGFYDLQRIDVSNPASPQLGATFSVPLNGWGTSVVVSGSSIYLGTSNKGMHPEFYILKYAGGALVQEGTGSVVDVGNVVRAVAVSGTRAYLATHVPGKEFMVIDITYHLAPYIRKSLNLGAFARSLAVSGPYAYIGTRDAAKELMIVKGVDLSGSVASGILESIAFDAGQSRIWERLAWSSVLNGGTVKFQVRWAGTAAALASASYVGPDGTGASTYTTSDTAITACATCGSPSAQWFQWRSILDGTGSSSPELRDVTVTFR